MSKDKLMTREEVLEDVARGDDEEWCSFPDSVYWNLRQDRHKWVKEVVDHVHPCPQCKGKPRKKRCKKCNGDGYIEDTFGSKGYSCACWWEDESEYHELVEAKQWVDECKQGRRHFDTIYERMYESAIPDVWVEIIHRQGPEMILLMMNNSKGLVAKFLYEKRE